MKSELEAQLESLQAAGKLIAVTHTLPATKKWLVNELEKSELLVLPFSDLSELEARSDIGAIVVGFSSLKQEPKQVLEIESLSRRLKAPFVVVSTSCLIPDIVEKEIRKRENKDGKFLPREIVSGLHTDSILQAIAQGLYELDHKLDGLSAPERFRIGQTDNS